MGSNRSIKNSNDNEMHKIRGWLWIIILLCLNSDATTQRADSRVPCETNEQTQGYCLPMVRCRRIINNISRIQNPNTCFVKQGLTHICCPVRLRTNRNPSSSSLSPAKTTPSTRAPSSNRPPAGRPTSGRITTVGINPPGCGKRPISSRGTGEVVGGREAIKYSWPWMAAIRVRTFGENTSFKCGGSLITPRHILTAAHCFDERGGPRPPSDFRIILGSHNRSKSISESTSDKEEGIVTLTPSAITVHEDYKDSTNENDVAVVTLPVDAPISLRIRPICLPTRRNYNKDDGYVIVIGWGDLTSGGRGSPTLQEAGFRIVPFNKCRSIFQQIPEFANSIKRGMLCAGGGKKDSCQNDSGGPLMEENVDENTWTQVGIVSFGIECAEVGYPGVYTRVANYVPWIERTVRRVPF